MVRVHFDGVAAVDGIDLTVELGEIKGLIGPNGAGKTTLLNAVTGFVRPTAGTVTLWGADVTGWRPERLVGEGIARTFQELRTFKGLTVVENVEVAALRGGLSRKQARSRTAELLEMMQVDHISRLRAGAIPLGDERRVGIARAAATSPRFLLLDEPAAGLNDRESMELVTVIKHLRDQVGCGVLLVDHDMRVIMNACERIHVLDSGKTIGEGTPEQVRRDPAVISAYLGGREDGEHARPR